MRPVPLTDEDAWRREQSLNERCFGTKSEDRPDMLDEKYLPPAPERPALDKKRNAA